MTLMSLINFSPSFKVAFIQLAMSSNDVEHLFLLWQRMIQQHLPNHLTHMARMQIGVVCAVQSLFANA